MVLVVVDTLRQDRVSAYGYERQTTPSLDRLASQGVLADGLSPTSWTKPSTASILTGLHPLRHQTYSRGDVLPESATSLAQVLSAEGYSTVAISANTWISRAWGFDRGFQHFHLMKALGHGHRAKAHEVTRVARERFDELRPPYFLYLHFVDPHDPYDPPAAWDGSPLSPDLAARRPIGDDTLFAHSFRKRAPELARAASDLYDGEVRHVDTEIGRLLADLAARFDRRDTILVVTSDHGEELGDHGRFGHGHTLHRETTAVPLVIHAPGRLPAGVRIGRASLMDIVPTVLALAGLERSARRLQPLDGRDLMPRVRRAATGGGQEPADSHLMVLDFDSGHALALIAGDRKLLLAKGPYRKAVFDLAADPPELRDLYAELTEPSRERLATELAETYNRLSRGALPRRTTTIDAELAANILAMGYLPNANLSGDARILPRRIRPADTLPGGLLGWEGLDPLSACVELGQGRSEAQLLDGWFSTERKEGRWTGPRATLVLAVPLSGAGHRLTVEGMSYRTDSFDLEIRSAEHTVLSVRGVPPGPFLHQVSLAPTFATGRPLLLEVLASPPFVPAQRMKSTDERVLGAFLERLCLEAR